MSTTTRRLGALVAASALTVTGLALGAAPAQAAPDTRALGQGVTWLKTQLDDGLIVNPNFGGIDDYGLSIDVALALKEIGGSANEATVKTIGKAIREHYYSYVTDYDSGFGDPGAPTEIAGAMGKALVMSQIAGSDPALYKSRVQSDLEDHVSEVAPLVGRIENVNDFVYPPPDFNPVPGDNANVFGQVFAARGLLEAGSDEAPEALAFLLSQQCADGGFREKFDAKDDVNQECGAGDTATYGDRIGATATAVTNLAGYSAETGVATALTNARTWLKTQQNQDGSFGADGGNANSTGLAARALGASDEASEAATWLRNLQANDTDRCTKLANSVGAIAFTSTSLADGRALGIPQGPDQDRSTVQGEWRRATAQAVPALAFLEADPAVELNLTGPGGFRKASTGALYTVSGAAADSKLCVTVGNNSRAGQANGSGNASIAPTLPAGTATRTVTVVDRNGNTDTTTTKVLGVAKLGVTPAAKTVKRGGTLKVTVSGLVAGEKVTVKVRTFTVTGTANSLGRFVAFVKPGRTLGKATVTATGQFADIRRGTAVITVVR